jgi:hypothetical protein
MQNVEHKYFWDGNQNLSDRFIIRRMLEYAAFPDLLKLPFDTLKGNLLHIDPDQLRTSEKRKQFLKIILPYLETANSLEDAVFQLIDHYFTLEE